MLTFRRIASPAGVEFRAFSAYFAFTIRRERVSGVWALAVDTKKVVAGIETPDERLDAYRDHSLARCVAISSAYADAGLAGEKSPMRAALRRAFK